MRSRLWGGFVSAVRRVRQSPHIYSKTLFLFALLLAIGTYGFEVAARGWWPHRELVRARSFYLTLKFQIHGHKKYGIVKTDEVPFSEVGRARIKTIVSTGASEKLLVTGGAGQFLDYCPQYGCLAVVLTRQGRLVTAVPLLPSEFKKKPFVDYVHDVFFRNPEWGIQIGSVVPLADGDFIFNIEDRGSYPLGGGIARLHPNGTIVWYRRDYAHHWSNVDADGNIISPSRIIARNSSTDIARLGDWNAECRDSTPEVDSLEVVDLQGRLIRELPVVASLAKSRFRSVLSETYNICDVTHLNFVRQVGPALAMRWKGVSPRDYLVSFRHLSAFAVLDARDGHAKQLIRGTFVRQHSVQPLPDGRIVMFDNEGMGEGAKPSRVLILDPANWSERTLFPTAQTPTSTDTYSGTGGYIDVSRDGKRLWVSIAEKGISYEIEIATGNVLTIYNNFHPAVGRDGKPLHVRRTFISQVQYFN